jgi:hypothetical protein
MYNQKIEKDAEGFKISSRKISSTESQEVYWRCSKYNLS